MKILVILLILFAFWCYHYFKFRRKNRYFSVMVYYLEQERKRKENYGEVDTKFLLRLSSALIKVQRYMDAFKIYQHIEQHFVTDESDKIQLNKKFCINPYPGCHGPKNLNHSYWHNFLLVRLGQKRYNFLTEEDFLMTNAMMRALKNIHQ